MMIRVATRPIRVVCYIALFALVGCASSFERPRNVETTTLAPYQIERQSMRDRYEETRLTTALSQNLGRCQDMDVSLAGFSSDIGLGAAFEAPALLSPGDLVRLEIVRGEGFQGDYVVSPDGYLRLPHIGDIPAAGVTKSDLENTIARLLVSGGYFQSTFVQVSIVVLHWAPIQVSVSGAVFQSGDVVINQKRADSDPEIRIDAAGDFAVSRRLSAALFAAAGVRPDADIRHVIITRNGRRRLFDMTGAMDGGPIEDPLLVAGDRVHVPSRGCFQIALARPSRITPPGIRVFMSNLTRPATNNASSAIGQFSSSLPYGTRFLQGLVSANCVGGIQATNARRWGVLISKNPVTGNSEVIARSIEDLVRRADRDDFNPVLLPNDALACYDSHVTNVRDVIAMVTETAAPILNAAVLSGVAR